MLIAKGASTGLVNNYFCAVNLYIFNSVIEFQINSTFCAFRHFYFLLFCGRRLGISYLSKPPPALFSFSCLYTYYIILFLFCQQFFKKIFWRGGKPMQKLPLTLTLSAFLWLISNKQG